MKIRANIQWAVVALVVMAFTQALPLSVHAKTKAEGVMPPEPATQAGETTTAAEGTQAHDGVSPRLVPATAVVPQGVGVGPSGARPGAPGSAAAQGLGLGSRPGYPGPGGPGSVSPQGINVGPGPTRPGPQGIDIGPPRRDLQIRVWTDQNNYRVGDKMRVYFRATQDCYLYIYNTDSQGVERQIYPNHFDQDNHIQPNVTFYIPDRSYEFTVTGPGGREKLYAIAVPERYDVVRPFSRFSQDDPYPKFQAQALLNSLRGGLNMAIGGQSGQGRQPDRIGPQGIIVNPAPDRRRRYEHAEDYVFYNVRPRGGPDYSPYGHPRRLGQLHVTTTPSNAVVYLNGERKGHSPLTITNIPYGNYRIYADKNNYQARGHWVVVDGPSMGYLHITLPPEVSVWRRGQTGGAQGLRPGGQSPAGGAVEKKATR